jgi:hypothetical protein
VYAYIDFARDFIPVPRVVLKDCNLEKGSPKEVLHDQQDSSSAAKKAKLGEEEREASSAPGDPTVSKPVENVVSNCPLDLMEAPLALPNNGQVEEVPTLPSFSSEPPLQASVSNKEKEGPSSASSPSSPSFRRMLTRSMRKHLFGAKDKVVVTKNESQQAKRKPKKTDAEVNSPAPAEDILDATATHETSLLNREDVPVVPVVKEEVDFIEEDEDSSEELKNRDPDAESDEEDTWHLESTAEVPPLPSSSSSSKPDSTATFDTSFIKREDVPVVPVVKQEVHFIVEEEDNNEDVQYWEWEAESYEEETTP